MKAEYTLVEVTTKRLLNEFINLPWIIYNDKLHDPYWVPPLKLAVNDILNPKHPFYQTSQMKKWLIYNDQKKYVGRIASIINHSHQNFHHDHVGHFGFFECVNDPEVAQLLFNQVKDDLTPYKVEKILGPVNPSTNYECGLLIEGVEDSPQIMMTYNPPYYVSLMEQAGFKKSMDLLAFNLPTDSPLPSKILRIAERIRTSHQITWRPVVKKIGCRKWS